MKKSIKILMFCFAMLFILTGCSESNTPEIRFSLTKGDGVIGNNQNTFKKEDTIYMAVPLSGKTATYFYVIEREGSVYHKGEIEVTPDWNGVVKEQTNPKEVGDYTIKYFSTKDEVLVSKGTFSIIEWFVFQINHGIYHHKRRVQNLSNIKFEKVFVKNHGDEDLYIIIDDGTNDVKEYVVKAGERAEVQSTNLFPFLPPPDWIKRPD